MNFFVVACDGAARYQSVDSCLRLSFEVCLSVPRHIFYSNHEYGFCYVIDGSAFNCEAAYMTSQRSAEVDWKLCYNDECWIYYKFDWGLFHEVHTMVVEISTQDANDDLFTRCALPLLEIALVVFAEHHVMFD